MPLKEFQEVLGTFHVNLVSFWDIFGGLKDNSWGISGDSRDCSGLNGLQGQEATRLS